MSQQNGVQCREFKSVTAGQGHIVNEQIYLQVTQCIANMYFKQTLFMREHNSKD